uniref:Uncharacterized protein n=1 Tax=Fundulus heteroclitus TaxID=8078 RepID=A0A3Q2NZG6_FUNHE
TQTSTWHVKRAANVAGKAGPHAADRPLLLQQGLRVLLVLPPPALQLSLHGVHVLLDVVHDLPERYRAPTHRLDGGAEPLDLPRHQFPLFLLSRLGHQVLKRESLRFHVGKNNLSLILPKHIVPVKVSVGTETLKSPEMANN